MSSQVEICNIALSNIRAQSINDINERSVQAQYCKLKYDIVLEFMLRISNWNFARKQVPLAVLPDELFLWLYTYQYPSDCLRINHLISQCDQISDRAAASQRYINAINKASGSPGVVEFEVINTESNKVIGCNEGKAWVDYNVKVVDPNKFDSHFIMAFSWYLTSEIAVPIIGGDSGILQKKNALDMYARTLTEAITINANENDIKNHSESEFISCR